MGYPTIEKFDIIFIERTLANVKEFVNPNTFTHLINSLVGLIFIPNEFNKKRRRIYKIDFLNKFISNYPKLEKIFSGQVILTDELGNQFQQRKFYYKNQNFEEKTTTDTTVGELVRLFRNGIAHSNITPVPDGDYWKGIIVKNFKTIKKEKANDFNFETFLNQEELCVFATLIAEEYLKNAN
ncbi:MAG TPA: HEPN family nuclease [Ignavibacteria bacterium]